MTVGLVIVSHSVKLAEGVAELAGQMAPDVTIKAAGGMDDGSIGTDFDRVCAALEQADTGDGAVLLYDLGSARMIADLAVESLANPLLAMVVDAPVVEGAVAAAVAAQGGGDLAGVARAAGERPPEFGAQATPAVGESVELVLRNEVGLHARPAALLVRTIASLKADVTVYHNGQQADARSVLALMGLSAVGGDTIKVVADGPDAAEALRRIGKLVEIEFEE
ncbi:dihydroxyacetone kinase phosphoryl donor subunit DhaM [Kutzneria sp. 744]|uniref:dihydroxyacetone kinase phosphoryl donor subunit DhaM n=1 Tax=Kutzneria sp. (strain 744) TaxID=345341 RepID=UPI0003EEAFA4|nr:dihydroxyacetone kinase phosphoryl donor subunit DhaM [Kutzneria sp. 744]EWM16134.1 PTS system hybrid protein [Kutzneria sp. 744]